MAVREQKSKPTNKKEQQDAAALPGSSKQATKLKGELDALLDEVDEVLEENAEEFVRNYVQKGGQ